MKDVYTVAELTAIISITRTATEKTANDECARLSDELIKIANKTGQSGQATVMMNVGKFENFTALHKYVCDWCGIDSTRKYETMQLSRDNLKQLKVRVDKVIDHFNKSEEWFVEYASEHFPTCSGTFFSATEYDELYKDNCVELTILIEELLKLMDEDSSTRVEYVSY